MEELIIAILDRIDNELQRCYWNKNQKHLNSPFANTGENYSNDIFTVRAYDWSDDQENDEPKPNFESKFLTCWWYKHAHRGLEFKITYDTNTEADHLTQLANFLNKCLNAIYKDFGQKIYNEIMQSN